MIDADPFGAATAEGAAPPGSFAREAAKRKKKGSGWIPLP